MAAAGRPAGAAADPGAIARRNVGGELVDGHGRPLGVEVPFLRWAEFLQRFKWQQGQHITIVGPTGRGKTTIALELLKLRRPQTNATEFVAVLATKARDEGLYPPLTRMGYVTHERWGDSPPDVHPHVILKPPKEARQKQADAFADAIGSIYIDGGWTVYADEVRYLTDTLRLKDRMELLWLQGRSLGVSLVVSTQRPVSIPLEAFDMATHLFLFRETDRVNTDRAASFSGADTAVARAQLPRLDTHEFLYVNTATGEMLRSDVRS
jgi:energy-coupling factor transporter ATP-binding protein EcfA2